MSWSDDQKRHITRTGTSEISDRFSLPEDPRHATFQARSEENLPQKNGHQNKIDI